jgi:hypothetical protein
MKMKSFDIASSPLKTSRSNLMMRSLSNVGASFDMNLEDKEESISPRVTRRVEAENLR